MLRTPNFGRKSLNEIKEVLNSMSIITWVWKFLTGLQKILAELSKKLEEANN